MKILAFLLAFLLSLSVFALGDALPDTGDPNELYIDNQKGIYNYAPSVIVEGDTVHMLYCSNMVPTQIIDHIVYRSATKTETGWAYTEKIDVLQPTPDTWDSQHVCDPSVIAGNFAYQGESYRYLMAYLGCVTTNNQENQVGFAVSNTLDSGWIKCDAINPVVACEYDETKTSYFQWGVGQPSLVGLEDGKVLLCYTSGTWQLTDQKFKLLDASNLDDIVILAEGTISNRGTQRKDLKQDTISNADFAIRGDQIYMLCDQHPFNKGALSIVSDNVPVYVTNITDGDIAAALTNALWTRVDIITSSDSGWDKNHNAGFFKTETGALAMPSVFVTGARETGIFNQSLYTYRMHKVDFGIGN